MIQEHARAGISHHSADAFAHERGVAVGLAVAAGWLVGAVAAMLEARVGIIYKSCTIPA